MEMQLNRDQLDKDVQQALRAWHNSGDDSADSLSYLLLVQAQMAAAPHAKGPAARLAVNQVLLNALEEIAVQDETAVRVLKLRFLSQHSLLMVANQLNVSEHTVSRMQRAAIDQLTAAIYRQELTLRDSKIQAITALLPPATYSELFGVVETQTDLAARLRDPGSPWVIAVTGLGGIGKTALADSVVRRLVPEFHFDDVVWLRSAAATMSGQSVSPQAAFDNLIIELTQHFWGPSGVENTPNQRLAQARRRLKERPFLIIIDNLESETDTAFLVTQLNDLANPSKFLLTSRTRPAPQAIVFTCVIPELSFDDSMALLNHHTQKLGIAALTTAVAADYQAIWNITGGHPLALKLVAGLLDVLPLATILGGLAQGGAGHIEEMYRHIYWQTWHTLSENGRRLLLTMPLVSETGGDPGYLCVISGLDETQLWPAIQELRSRSLLEVRGSLHEKSYGIHRLTETFLNTEIINWPYEEQET